MANARMVTVAGRLGTVEEYAVARLWPEPGRLVTCSAMFDDYRSWCEQAGLAPLREAEFTAVFESVARAAGIPIRQRGSNLSFIDTALRAADAG